MNFSITGIVKAFFIAIAGWLIVAANWKLLPSAFPGFWLEWPPFHHGEDEMIYSFLFSLSKVMGLLLLALYVLVVVDWTGEKSMQFTRWLDGNFKKLVTITLENWKIAIQYDKGVKLVFILWALLMLTCLLTLPYHYDEAWSYHYFSRQGWLRTISFYPLPNNHIFFNLIVVLFSWLPFDTVITTRLPSLFAVFIGSFYFLKLCRFYFSGNLSVFLTLLLSSMYPFILYGVEGRGYGFMICFSILQLYGANQLALEYRNRKYRMLYFFALVAGLYTITSHLYFVLPVHALLFAYVVKNKRWRVFMFDSIKAALVVLVLYWIIVYCNGLKVLTHPNGSVHPDDKQLMPAIWEHLRSTWFWLTDSHLSIFSVLLLLLAPMADCILKKRKIYWLNISIFVLLISPPFILFFQRLVFYVRLWTYLIVPMVIGLGFLLSLVATVITPSSFYPRLRRAVYWYPSVLAVMLLINFSLFIREHRKSFAIDYAIEVLFRKIQPDLSLSTTIYFTRQSLEFYAAEQLVYREERINPDRPMEMSAEGAVSGQDVLILSPSIGVKEIPQLVNYKLAGQYPGVFSLYIKK